MMLLKHCSLIPELTEGFDFPEADVLTVEHLSRVKDYDVLVGLGTDTSLEFYKRDPYCEFRLHHDVLGFSNIDVLKHATINNAILMMQDGSIGTVKKGKLADLIVVDGDPAADLSVMYRKPEHVIKNGVLIR